MAHLIPVPDLKATNSFSRISDSGDLLRISSRLIQIWYQICSSCGEAVNKSLAVRTHHCDSCGLSLDRDVNAAINIKRAASVLRGGVLVANSPEKLPLGERNEKPVSPKELSYKLRSSGRGS